MELLPTAEIAAREVLRSLGTSVRTITRFPMGLAHYVFDVLTMDGRCVVVRMGTVDQVADFAGAVYWRQILAPRGVPLPEFLAWELDPPRGSLPFVLMKRLLGRDLADEYSSFSLTQKRRLAREIVRIQTNVGELPPGPGYGYAHSYEDTSLYASWSDFLAAALERSRSWLDSVGSIPSIVVDRVAEKLPPFDAYFAAIPPTPFLDDITVKNVLIHDGRLTGIVDVDVVCFGDALFTVALTQMALFKRRFDTAYITAWADEMNLAPEQHAVLSLYTAMHCVSFMGELGQRFNRDEAIPVDKEEVAYLSEVLDNLLATAQLQESALFKPGVAPQSLDESNRRRAAQGG
jgi:aminoglycoside phosphotransferase (APT) family kinase protein